MELGRINDLTILRETSVGLFLGDDKDNEVLLPTKYVPDEWDIDDEISVFVFRDSENRPIATTDTPKIEAGGFALLKVVHNTRVGSFVDWGMDKDLLVPYRHQHEDLVEGESYMVYMWLDAVSDRLIGATKLHPYLRSVKDELNVSQSVEIIFWENTDIGTKVIVNNRFKGMVYSNELFEDVVIGERKRAFVKNIRPDGKLDISLKPLGYAAISDETEKILQILRKNGGQLDLNDKSDPADISAALQMSKKSFKKAIGALYKARQIEISGNGIKLLN